MKDESIASKLVFAQNAITNSLTHEQIKSSLAIFGYDDTRLQEGQTLQQSASNLQDKQMKEYGEQFEATEALSTTRDAAYKEYMVHLKVARVALKGDKNAEKSLAMDGRRKDSLSGWLGQAKTFYANAITDSDILKSMAKFGITKAKLKATQDKVLDVEAKMSAQLREKGEAQAATQARDEALDDLQEWMGDFVSIARIALEDQPQYIEMLGIVESN